MPRINVLPRHVFELIAAGEVVERPAGAVKELVENSIDAGAKKITVEIKNGGVSFIRVTDNGCGIERADIRNAFISHSTSKISSADDLDKITSLGFRGEALPSIAAVSRVDVLTKSSYEPVGTRYCVEFGDETYFEDAGCPDGTTIVVKNLFEKTPARMKFLKKDVTEGNAVASVIEKLALSHPDISFRFIRDGKPVLTTGGSNSLIECIREVFGKEFSSELLSVNYSLNNISVTGYVSKPDFSKSNRNMQFVFLNGRYIKSITCQTALSEAYKNSVMIGRFPACVLNLSVNPETVDVNIHPTKTEVRFSDERSIFNCVYSAAQNALIANQSNKQIRIKNNNTFAHELLTKNYFGNIQQGNQTYINVDSPNNNSVSITSKRESNDYFLSESSDEFLNRINKKNTVVAESPKPVVNNDNESLDDILLFSQKENILKTESQNTSFKDETDFNADESGSVNEEKNPLKTHFKYVGEVFKTYLICEYDNNLLFIDKHAAHERLIYEKLKSEHSQRHGQVLLFPVSLVLSKDEYSAVVDNLSVLADAGFDISDYGDGTVSVNECPMELDVDDITDVIKEVADGFIKNKRNADYELLDNLFHSIACKSAIKAGYNNTREEMAAFAEKIINRKDIRHCPHGRPVLIEMTQRELEKNFGRIQ